MRPVIPSSVVAAYGNQHAVYQRPLPNDQNSRHSVPQHQTDTHFTYETHDQSSARSGRSEQSNPPANQSHAPTHQWRAPSIPEQPPHRTSVPDLRRQPTQSAPATSDKPFTASSASASSSTSSKPAHPVVIKNAANALAPIRHLYEKAWIQTVTNVQNEMSRMHAELLDVIEAERKQHAFTAQMNISAREELKVANEKVKNVQSENGNVRAELRSLRAENLGLREEVERARAQCELLKAENRVTRRAQQDDADLREDFDQVRAEEGQKAAKDYMDRGLQAMKTEFEKQLEVQIAVLMKEVQEQKALRASAERKLKQFRMITERVFSSPENSTTDLPSANANLSRSSEPATLIGTPEAEHIPRMKREHEESEGILDNASCVVFDQPRASHVPSSVPNSRMSSPIPRSPPQISRHASTRPLSPPSGRLSPLPLSSRRTSPIVISPYLINSLPNDDGRQLLAEHVASRLTESHPPRPLSSSSRPISRAASTAPPLSLSIPPPSSLHEGTPTLYSSKRSRPPSPQPPSASHRRPSFSPFSSNFAPRPRSPDPGMHSQLQLQRSATTPTIERRQYQLPPLQVRDGEGGPRKRDRSEFERGDEGVHLPVPDTRRVRHHTSPTPTRSFTDPGGTRPWVKREEGEIDSGGIPRENAEEGEIQDDGDVNGRERKQKSNSSSTRVRTPVRNKIGINHMDLLYETRGDKMVCRMCRTPAKGEQAPTSPATFPTKASWAELVGHCQTAHPKSCEELERLSPSQVAELRQRMTSSNVFGFRLS
ncbi:hypothetical protein Hypma_012631 [Hypsizygus marmoreus]|uniref:Uncharacterized protein n=1 Tax=Hypsizygus marmoreus TaxID=39966 RepID=A0A369JLN2_HYPMA|nr:hypothetical protein Hypma_012631 [Hypsizygus marmoreus]